MNIFPFCLFLLSCMHSAKNESSLTKTFFFLEKQDCAYEIDTCHYLKIRNDYVVYNKDMEDHYWRIKNINISNDSISIFFNAVIGIDKNSVMYYYSLEGDMSDEEIIRNDISPIYMSKETPFMWTDRLKYRYYIDSLDIKKSGFKYYIYDGE